MIGGTYLIHRIAKRTLWIIGPILLYAVLVPGVWDGFLSDFDATRAYLMKTHYAANAYALEHMSARARYRTCKDQRIELTDDGKAVCSGALNAGPGEQIPGSEHRCGLFGMFACFDTVSEK